MLQSITAFLVLALLVIVGLDPLVGVFGSMAGVATVGMVLLMLATSIAVVVFFARRPEAARGRTFTTRVAPVAATVGLLLSLWLVLSNFTLVTGGTPGVSIALAVVPAVAFLLGVALGGRFTLGSGDTPPTPPADAPAPGV